MATYYVSALGNDSWSGQSADPLGGTSGPFQTLERALEAMQANPGADTVLVREGTYFLDAPLSLTGVDSNITIAAYGNEHPVISGGATVSGWTVGADGVWSAHLNVNDVQQFVVNDSRQIEARYPNFNPSDPIKGGWLWAKDLPTGHDPQSEMAYNKADFAPGQLAAGMKVTVFSDNGYASDVLTIASVDTKLGILTFDQNASYDIGASSRFFVSDGQVHLDQPGEWWFDEVSHTLFYRPPSGFDGSGGIVSSDNSLVTISGAHNITITGLSFANAATTSQTDDIFTAAIAIDNSSGIVVTGNKFINDAKGVLLDDNTDHNTIAGNTFDHLWSTAIDVTPSSHENLITNNTISNSGEVFINSGAIQMTESWGNTVSHNLIQDVPGFGISEGNYDPALQSGGNVIEYNTILHSGQERPDVGAIYVFSHSDPNALGDTIRYNTIIDTGGLNTVAGGFVPGNDFSFGIYLDDFTSNAQVYGNFVEGAARAGVYLHGGTNNQVYNNILIDNAELGVLLFEIDGKPMTGTTVHDNIIETPASGDNSIDVDPTYVSPARIYDNIYYSPNGSPPRIADLSWAQWLSRGGDVGSDVTANPGFTNAAAGDYSLTSNAFALSQGFVNLPWGLMAEAGVSSTSTSDPTPVVSPPPLVIVSSVDYTLPTDVNNLVLMGNAVKGTGNAADNTITGDALNNVLDGKAGADTMIGGAGNDTYYVDNPSDVVVEKLGEGTDTVNSTVDYTLPSNVEALVLAAGSSAVYGTGNSSANTITGNALDNVLDGKAGADTMIGGAGNDTYYVDNPSDVVVEKLGEGTDTIYSSVNYTLPSQVENLTLTGSAINGTGNMLDNTIVGNAKANVVNGGAGNDVLTGGAGADTFVFNTALSSTANVDHITDFNPSQDVINLENAIFTALTKTGTLTQSAFYIGSGAHDSNDHIIYNSQTGALIYDANGNAPGGDVVFAMLATGLHLDRGDFHIV